MTEVPPGYQVIPPQLLVIDSNGFFDPEIYTIPANFDSFEINGRTYLGISDAFERLTYHTTYDEWNYNMDYIEGGHVNEFEV